MHDGKEIVSSPCAVESCYATGAYLRSPEPFVELKFSCDWAIEENKLLAAWKLDLS